MRLVETDELRDRAVNMQVGAFIAAPVVGIVLICRPEAQNGALAAMVALMAALRRSYFRHRHIRVT
ncbi:hypothetical protein [Streptomyces sp. ME19-01-6]|uniref:hypothetical protein n=1 Tax=Streptomyces sp. ME19-01-6 TaxID=3028686 RepID=UPI0029BF26CB|nr:hypothetical protein [Streptomyces sp. ME19-01-6]MDX3229237.1 hypothetical protein [Streptomyces sp. ME19-01-6]